MLNRLGRRLLRGDESMSSSFDCSFALARGRGKKGLVLELTEKKGFEAFGSPFWFLRLDVTVWHPEWKQSGQEITPEQKQKRE